MMGVEPQEQHVVAGAIQPLAGGYLLRALLRLRP
jgi:hypothetical protein